MYTMAHSFGNSERVINRSNSNVKRIFWQIDSICAAIITHWGNSGAKERSHVSHHFLAASTDAALVSGAAILQLRLKAKPLTLC